MDNSNKNRAMSWAMIFLLLASAVAWVMGENWFFAAFVGAVLGGWLGAENLPSRLKNGLSGIGRVKFWALFWMSLGIFLGFFVSFIFGELFNAERSLPLFAALFGAIRGLVLALESVEFIERFDGVPYWVIAGMIIGPIIGKAVAATVIYDEINRRGQLFALFALFAGGSVGVIFGILYARRELGQILNEVRPIVVIYLASLLFGATVLELFDDRDAFVMVVVISAVWHFLWLMTLAPWHFFDPDFTDFRERINVILAIAFFSVCHILALAQDLQEYKLLQALKQEGVPTLALVQKCSGGGKSSYHITYQYEVVASDQQIEHYTKGERASDCRKLVNSQINIRYLPQDPSQASAKEDGSGHRALMAFTGIYFLILIWTVYQLWIIEKAFLSESKGA